MTHSLLTQDWTGAAARDVSSNVVGLKVTVCLLFVAVREHQAY